MADEFLTMINDWYKRCLTTDIKIIVATDKSKSKSIEGVHFHLTPEVFMQEGGSSTFTLPSGDILVEAGNILIIPSGVPHIEHGRNTTTPFQSNVLLHRINSKLKIHFAKLTPNKIPKEFKIRQYDLKDMSPAISLLDTISAISLQGYTKQNTIRHIMAAYLTIIADTVMKEPKRPQNTNYSSMVDKAILFIETNFYDSSCNVKTISDKINCTPNYLSSLFKKEVGQTFSSFIYDKRMNYASNLLSKTNLTVAQIAQESGYEDASYFIKSFKKKFNISPKQFIKN